DQAERSALDLDLRHDPVTHDLGDEPDEPVPGGAPGIVRNLRCDGMVASDQRNVQSVDHLTPSIVCLGGQEAALYPATHRVVADPQVGRRIFYPQFRHEVQIGPASAGCQGCGWLS